VSEGSKSAYHKRPSRQKTSSMTSPLRCLAESDIHQYRAASALFHQGRIDDAGFLERLGAIDYRELAEPLWQEADSPCF